MTATLPAMIVDTLVEALAADLADAVYPEESVTVVKGGRLQEDPTESANGLSVTVHLGDPDDDGWRDGSTAMREESLYRTVVQAPAFEVGGGSTYWRRGTVKWSLFDGTGADQDTARDRAAAIGAKIERSVARAPVAGLTDDLGQVAVQILQTWSHAREAGGPPDSYIWRGTVGWEALTGRPY